MSDTHISTDDAASLSFSSSIFLDRTRRVQQTLSANTAVLIARPSHIHYFTGFETLVPAEREALLYISANQVVFIGSSFLPPVAHPEIVCRTGVQAKILGKTLEAILASEKSPITSLQCELSALFAEEYQSLQKVCPVQPFVDAVIWDMRMIKDNQEIHAIGDAARVALASFQSILPKIQVGMTERDVLKLLDAEMRAHDGQPAFPTIVAFGPHAALPHHQPLDTPLTENTAILIDWGCQKSGYCSDFTRSWWFGDAPDSEWQKIEGIVRAAYDAAVSQLLPGGAVSAADTAAREYIRGQGYGNQFIHTTGHGIGIDVHEAPSVYLTSTATFRENMVVTVEPGIYLEGKFGYRHENTFVIGKSAAISLG